MPFNLSPSRGFDTSARARFTNKACRINSEMQVLNQFAKDADSSPDQHGESRPPEEVEDYGEKEQVDRARTIEPPFPWPEAVVEPEPFQGGGKYQVVD